MFTRMVISNGVVTSVTDSGYYSPYKMRSTSTPMLPYFPRNGKRVVINNFLVTINSDGTSLSCKSPSFGIKATIKNRFLTVWCDGQESFKGYVCASSVLNGILILTTEYYCDKVSFVDSKFDESLKNHGIMKCSYDSPCGEFKTLGLDPKKAFFTDGKICFKEKQGEYDVTEITDATWTVVSSYVEKNRIKSYSSILTTLQDPMKVLPTLPKEIKENSPFARTF